MPQISWADVHTKDVTDDAGRSFNWSKLKGKRIYLCGHGAHFFKEGFCSVPASTTISFYRTYGRAMMGGLVPGFILDHNKLPMDRSFTGGQHCPAMTLFQDDDDAVAESDAALKKAIQTNPNTYVFNVNQFSGVPTYSEAGPHVFNGKGILRLREIMQVLSGNLLDWACCQDLMGWHKYAPTPGDPPKTVYEQREWAARATDRAVEEKAARFSKDVKLGIYAAISVPTLKANMYNNSFENSRIGEVHSEGSWQQGRKDVPKEEWTPAMAKPQSLGHRYAPQQFLNRARVLNRESIRKDIAEKQNCIRIGQSALKTEAQPSASTEDRHWAEKTMLEGTAHLNTFLRNFIG